MSVPTGESLILIPKEAIQESEVGWTVPKRAWLPKARVIEDGPMKVELGANRKAYKGI